MRVRAVIEDSASTVFVSAVSAWEVTTKVRGGKWPEAAELATEFELVLAEHSFTPLPVTIRHGWLAGSMAEVHRDPFDRMLAAQAMLEEMPLVTADPAFRNFDVQVLW